MNPLDNAAMWAMIVGFLTPLLVQFVARPGLSRQVQAVIAFAATLVLAVPTVYFSSDFTAGNYVKDALLVFVTAMVAYKRFWNPLGVTPSNSAEHTG